jgi:mannose-1-phosphate guanylyltransferase
VLEREFTAIKGVSIDYAVMEHSKDIVVVEAPFTWDDVGSWQAIARLGVSDEHGNTIVGRHLGFETKASVVRAADGHLVVTVGMKDCIVVHTPDATLVANKHDEESIRKVVQRLRELGWTEFL